jgi:hypothetical protein
VSRLGLDFVEFSKRDDVVTIVGVALPMSSGPNGSVSVSKVPLPVSTLAMEQFRRLPE